MKIISKLFIAVLMVCSVSTAFAQKEQELSDVVVTGTRSAATARSLPFSISTVDSETLTENYRTNILQTLTEQVPGLFVTQRAMMGYGVSGGAAGGINMRGISSGTGQLLVLIDGHPQYQGVFGHSISDSYQTMMTGRVEVLRGPASVLYGSNAMGGVVNIITAKPVMREDYINTTIQLGAGSWGTVQTEVANNLRKGKFSSSVAGHYSRTDNHRRDMGFEQYGGYAKAAYDLSDHWNAFADIDITHFNASYPGTTTSPLLDADQWITRGVATIALENNYHNTSGRISAYNNWGYHKINDGHAPTAAPKTDYFRSTDHLLGLSFYQSASLWKGGNATLGADFQHIYGNAYYTDIATDTIVTTKARLMQSAKQSMNEIAVYADLRQDITSWLTVDAGIRFDTHSVSGTEWIPQFAAIARTSSNSEVRLSASKGFRNPTIKEMYLYGSANDELLPERLWNYELSWRQALINGRLRYGINLYVINGDNMIQTVNKKNINTGSISNRGAEMDASWMANKYLTLMTNHSFLHMKHHVVGAPEYKGYMGARLHICKWAATLGMQQLSALFTAVNPSDPSADKKRYATLVNATVSYSPTSVITLWAKGDNLLSQTYELQDGLPMPRATFMAGVKVNL